MLVSKDFNVYREDVTRFLSEITHLESVFTSIPDPEETGHKTFFEYKKWFKGVAVEIMQKTDENGYCIFYQTDRKSEARLLSKAAMLLQMADNAGLNVVYHKICLTQEPEKINLFRPTYTHLICFSKSGKAGISTPDVIYAGKKVYKNATGFNACTQVFNFLKSKKITKLYDLFCGQGSIAFIGRKYFDFEVISLDIDMEQCKKTIELLQSIMPTL